MLTTRTRLLSLLLILAASFHVYPGGRRRAVAAPILPADLSIEFVDAGNAPLDTGAISFRPGKKTAGTIRTFALRIGRPSREARGTASLRAFVQTGDPRCLVRIDGIPLGPAPRVIQHHAPIGIAMRHRLEIDVPPEAPEGALLLAIGWEVSTE